MFKNRLRPTIHFCENTFQNYPIIRYDSEKLQTVHALREHVMINRTMVLWHGPFLSRQYIPLKPAIDMES